MYQQLSTGEAAKMALDLVRTADELEARFRYATERPKGAGWNGVRLADDNSIQWGCFSTFEEALAEIRLAARWYQKVAKLGFGVHAWY